MRRPWPIGGRLSRLLGTLGTIAAAIAGSAAVAAPIYAVAHHELRAAASGGLPAAGAQVIVLTAFAIVAVIAALVAFALDRLFAYRLGQLRDAVSRLAAGDRDLRLGWTRVDTLGRVGRAFDELVVTLAGNEQRLSAHVTSTLRLLAAAVDAKDGYGRDHSRRVASYAAELARELGWSPEHVELVHTAGLLHDVGKVAVPDAILLCPYALTSAEREAMQSHAVVGERLVAGAGMPEIGRWIRHHHERPDGRGYPDALAGDAIPLEARILALADAFDTLTSDRAYQEALTPPAALAELRRCAGSQFDPELVTVLTRLVDAGRLFELRAKLSLAA